MRFCEPLPCEAQHAEDDGEDAEAGDLDGLAAQLVDGEDGQPVPWERARADQHDLPDGGVAEVFVDVVAFGEAEGGD